MLEPNQSNGRLYNEFNISQVGVFSGMSRQKIIDMVITSLACFFTLIGLISKAYAFMDGQWINAGGAVIFYLLQFSLFVFRHPSRDVANQPSHFFFALSGTCLPLLMDLNPNTPELLMWAAFPLQIAGMILSIIAMGTLGRGFGIFAANRQVKTYGLYRHIRHPLYTGEAIWFLSMVLQNFTLFNMALYAVQTACQIKRMRDEEALLLADPVYATYYDQVRFRMVPGIF